MLGALWGVTLDHFGWGWLVMPKGPGNGWEAFHEEVKVYVQHTGELVEGDMSVGWGGFVEEVASGKCRNHRV